jgi:hypothetical protein
MVNYYVAHVKITFIISLPILFYQVYSYCLHVFSVSEIRAENDQKHISFMEMMFGQS